MIKNTLVPSYKVETKEKQSTFSLIDFILYPSIKGERFVLALLSFIVV